MQVAIGPRGGKQELIRERTGKGRQRPKEKGVRFGQKFKLCDYHRAETLRRRDAGETLTSIARSYRVDPSMISRLRPNCTP
jgi:hypothetical protein